MVKTINAGIDYLDNVYDLICELEDEDLDKDRFSHVYRSNISSNNIYYILAVDEKKVVGFASLHIQQLLHHCAKIGELQEIIVSQKQQGLGVGEALFSRIKEIATENNCMQLEACCNTLREQSHKFYLKQGMEKSHYKFTYALAYR